MGFVKWLLSNIYLWIISWLLSNVYSFGPELTYLVKHETKGKRCYTENVRVPHRGHLCPVRSVHFWTNHWHLHGNKLYSAIFSFTHMRQSLYKNLSKRKEFQNKKYLNQHLCIWMTFCQLITKKLQTEFHYYTP